MFAPPPTPPQVTYEDLQRDQNAVLRDLLRHLGPPGLRALRAAGLPSGAASEAAEAAGGGGTPSSSGPGSSGSSGAGPGSDGGGAGRGGDGWVKRTSDDLRLTLGNFDEIHSALKRSVHSSAPHTLLSLSPAFIFSSVVAPHVRAPLCHDNVRA